MKIVLADTFYFFALLNPRDEFHGRRVAWSKSYSGRLLTTEWILLEVADGLASTRQRSRFGDVRQKLFQNPACQVVRLDTAVHQEGINLYLARPDKDWSLTDCVSFVVMENEGIREALTGDHHFEQAGFVPVFKTFVE